MDRLKDNWLTDGLIDFEYKKYVLLAYLKHVKDSFDRVELYPHLSDLVFHYRNLISLKENKGLIVSSFPRELSLENLRTLELNYRKIIEDDAVMQEIESIMQFALPQLRDSVEDGSSIYDFVESQCELTAVGVVPLYMQEGYMLITQPPEKETNIYRYQMTVYHQSQEPLRGLATHWVSKTTYSLTNTYENIKRNLIREFKDLPNPAAFVIISQMRFPYQSTLVPVAKRLLVKHLSQVA
ncbi:MAG TPA: hypothetical protein PLX35_03965 [Cyclobacteriaceae bacterium]|nr:hypothetical protein [Cyclobacteriaceae bacterium]